MLRRGIAPGRKLNLIIGKGYPFLVLQRAHVFLFASTRLDESGRNVPRFLSLRFHISPPQGWVPVATTGHSDLRIQENRSLHDSKCRIVFDRVEFAEAVHDISEAGGLGPLSDIRGLDLSLH